MSKAIAYIYDFLSSIFEDEELIKEINEIILFGSIAKKTSDKESDIDLFFNIKNEKETKNIERELSSLLKSFEVKSEKTWKLKNISYPINFIVGGLMEEKWKELRDEIISSGIILYSQYKEMSEKTTHYHLFYYSLSDIKRKDKMKFIREAFGYSLKKGKKEYIQKGLIENINGEKLSPNTILVPSQEAQTIKKLFLKYKIKYKILEAWIRE